MANRQKGEIRFDVEGKRYTLVLDLNAMEMLEDHFSTPDKDMYWDQIWLRVMRGSVKTVVALMWAMLQTHHPTITIEQTRQLIDKAGGLVKLADIIAQAGKVSTPDPQDVKELDLKRPQTAQKTRRGTGGGSTSTRGASV